MVLITVLYLETIVSSLVAVTLKSPEFVFLNNSLAEPEQKEQTKTLPTVYLYFLSFVVSTSSCPYLFAQNTRIRGWNS